MNSSAPIAAQQVVSRTIAGETLLVPVGERAAGLDTIFLLNKVGAFVWQQLDGKRTRDELCQLVRSRFAVPEGRDLSADVDRFLAALSARGLIAVETQASDQASGRS
jgi:hypothetical protein